MSSLNVAYFEQVTNNINTVLKAFNDGSMIVVFTHNNTIAMSKALHSEDLLMKLLQHYDHVRICSE